MLGKRARCQGAARDDTSVGFEDLPRPRLGLACCSMTKHQCQRYIHTIKNPCNCLALLDLNGMYRIGPSSAPAAPLVVNLASSIQNPRWRKATRRRHRARASLARSRRDIRMAGFPSCRPCGQDKRSASSTVARWDAASLFVFCWFLSLMYLMPNMLQIKSASRKTNVRVPLFHFLLPVELTRFSCRSGLTSRTCACSGTSSSVTCSCLTA